MNKGKLAEHNNGSGVELLPHNEAPTPAEVCHKADHAQQACSPIMVAKDPNNALKTRKEARAR